MNENHGLMVEYLGPSGSLLELNKGVLGAVAEMLNNLDQNTGKINLYKWMRDTLTLATSASLYGPHDPVSADHSLIDSLWLAIITPYCVSNSPSEISTMNRLDILNSGFGLESPHLFSSFCILKMIE